MQFHLNGFKPGDPTATASQTSRTPVDTNRALPGTTDVLVVGSGPAGLTLAAQLAAFPDIQTVVVEQEDGPLRLGKADGHCVPDHGDVPCVRFRRPRDARSVLRKRSNVLEARPGPAGIYHSSRPRSGCGGWTLRVPARGS